MWTWIKSLFNPEQDALFRHPELTFKIKLSTVYAVVHVGTKIHIKTRGTDPEFVLTPCSDETADDLYAEVVDFVFGEEE